MKDIKNEGLLENLDEFKEESEKDLNNFSIYMEQVPNELLTKEEEQQLGCRIKAGDMEALKILVEKNLRLVVFETKKFLGRGMSKEDLIQEGNMGIIKAAERFDPTKGFRFSTYAIWWIDQAMMNALNTKVKFIYEPLGVVRDAKKYFYEKSNLENKLGRTLSYIEIASELELPIEIVAEYEMSANPIVSINTSVGEEKDSELSEFIASNAKTPEEEFINRELNESVNELLNNCRLNEREIKILKMRNGIGMNAGEPMSLDEVGKIMNLSRQRIKQLEEIALDKIRRTKKTEAYVCYAADPEKALENLRKIRASLYSDGSSKSVYGGGRVSSSYRKSRKK